MEKYENKVVNKNTYDLLFNKEPIISSELTNAEEEKLFIIKMLEIYTKEKDINIVTKMFSKDTEGIKFSHQGKIHNFYAFNKNIEFELLSENLIPAIEDKKEELESDKRDNKCHQSSVEIVNFFENAQILTGIIKKGKKLILHSVIEIFDKEPKIIDYSKNLIMRKKDYIDLFEFKIFTEIKGEYLEEDLKLLEECGLYYIGCKTYLAFRNEIMNELNKNKLISRK